MNSDAATKSILRSMNACVDFFSRFGLDRDFVRFGIVGSLGFVWDTATVYALKGVAGLYIAGSFGFLVAGTINWAINRFWTFRRLEHIRPHHQLLRFLLANSIGFIFNRGTFFILVAFSPLCRSQPVLAIIAGSAMGLYFNYFLTKRFVFN